MQIFDIMDAKVLEKLKEIVSRYPDLFYPEEKYGDVKVKEYAYCEKCIDFEICSKKGMMKEGKNKCKEYCNNRGKSYEIMELITRGKIVI